MSDVVIRATHPEIIEIEKRFEAELAATQNLLEKKCGENAGRDYH